MLISELSSFKNIAELFNPIYSSIIRHQNDLFDWILEDYLSKKKINKEYFSEIVKISAYNGNAHSLMKYLINALNFQKHF